MRVSVPPPGQWPPPPGQPQGAQSWGPPPQGWNQPSGPPPGGNRTKWIVGGLALLVVVVVTVVATLIVSRGDSGSGTSTASPPSSPSTSVDTSDIASADDRGPVGIILEDPTCAAWEPIAKTLSERQQNGWDKRDASIPSTAWSPEQRTQYEEVGRAIASAADQSAVLAKRTPHRVMRELYEQSIAYWRAYADRLSSYTPADDSLILVANSTSGAIVWICAAITYGSAAAREPLIAPGIPPLSVADIGDPSAPTRFLEQPSDICPEWGTTAQRLDADTGAWAAVVDPNLPGSQWSAEQQNEAARITTILQTNADRLQQLGIESKNPILDDFAALAAQYRRAYVQAIVSYVPADNYLNSTAAELVVAVDQACEAAKG